MHLLRPNWLWRLHKFTGDWHIENVLDRLDLRWPDGPGCHHFGHNWGANLGFDFAIQC